MIVRSCTAASGSPFVSSVHAQVGVAPAVSRPAPRVATAKALLALPEAPIRVRDLGQVPMDDLPTGSFPRVSGTGGFPAAPSSTGGFPVPPPPRRGLPLDLHPDDAVLGVTDTGPRHAVRR